MNVTVTSLPETPDVSDNEPRIVHTSPDSARIRESLEKILSSDTFATAGRHSRLLRYLVDRTLAGEGEQLKEYVLGTEVFDRSDAYDPRMDSIVRVEVRRLRSRLEDYYRGPGASDAVVISIPRGSYVPVFEERSTSPATLERMPAVAHTPTAGMDRRYSPAAIIAAALSVVVVVIASSLALNSRDSAQASTTPAIAVLPFEHFSAREEDALLVAQLTDAVTAALARTGSVAVASRTTAGRYAGRPISEVADALRVQFVMESSAVVTGDLVHIVARLVDARTDRKIWVGEYDVPRSSVAAEAQRIGRDAAAGCLRYLNRE